MTAKKLNIHFLFSAIVIAAFLITGCSTKKNTWSRRAYHNVTCHYNVYWNGGNSLNEGVKNLHENVVENYNEVLRVYNYGTKPDAQKTYPKMDRTIKKASIGIQKHSMYFSGRERIKWVRRSYLMMGKAHFIKQDYISARRVFDYVAKQYEDDPIHYEGYLWLAKTHIQMERFEKAIATLNYLQSILDEPEFPSTVKRDLVMVQGDYFLAMEDYNSAYPYIERGIELGNERNVITRAHFILGQINQMDGDLDLATAYYQKVINRNPDYIMAFEARMNMAQCYDEGTGDSKNINKVLNKMAKDFRNKEFLDQIYFALADIALKDGEVEKAIEYLKLSVSSSVKDNYQKSTSALRLADLYFEQSDYVPAEAYYDTAVSFLPPDYPNYDIIKNKATVLSDIVIYAQTIHLQDSLQRLASMDSTELYAVIDLVIADYQTKKEQEQIELEERMEQGDVTQFVNVNDRNNQRLGGKWYFYNSQAMSTGRSEFINKWGNRKLEDNWRISDKRGMLQGQDQQQEEETVQGVEPGAQDSTQVESKPSDPMTRGFYLADIPNTEEELLASTEMIVEAYQKLGFLYLEELNDTINALDTYLEFQEKYPDNKYRIESWYALYKIYNERGDEEKAAYYKSLIVSNYPESDYARVIMDPDYFIKISEQKGKSVKLYERTYQAFEREQWFRVITYADKALEEYPTDTSLMPRFLYLRAISLGKVDVPDTLYAALDNLIITYPDSPIIPRAQSILRMLQLEYGLGVPEDKKQEMLEEASREASLFSYDPDALHMFMIITNTAAVDIDPLKVRLSDFKKKYFRLERLRIKSVMLDNQRAIVTIGNFESTEKAFDFYSTVANDEYVLSGMSSDVYELFTISINNYPIFYREKNVTAYREFFEVYYKKD